MSDSRAERARARNNGIAVTVLVVVGLLALVGFADRCAQNPEAVLGRMACFGFLVLPFLHVALTVYVARDAKARGMDGSALWMLITLFLGLLGLVIYLLSRPSGQLVVCTACGNSRLRASVRCPHCSNGWGPKEGALDARTDAN